MLGLDLGWRGGGGGGGEEEGEEGSGGGREEEGREGYWTGAWSSGWGLEAADRVGDGREGLEAVWRTTSAGRLHKDRERPTLGWCGLGFKVSKIQWINFKNELSGKLGSQRLPGVGCSVLKVDWYVPGDLGLLGM